MNLNLLNLIGYPFHLIAAILAYRAMKRRPEIQYLNGFFIYSVIATIVSFIVIFHAELNSLFSTNIFFYKNVYLITLFYHFYFISSFLLNQLSTQKKWVRYFRVLILIALVILSIQGIRVAKVSAAYFINFIGVLTFCGLFYWEKKFSFIKADVLDIGTHWIVFGIVANSLIGIPFMVFFDSYLTLLDKHLVFIFLLGNIPGIIMFGSFSKAFWEFAKNDSNSNSG